MRQYNIQYLKQVIGLLVSLSKKTEREGSDSIMTPSFEECDKE